MVDMREECRKALSKVCEGASGIEPLKDPETMEGTFEDLRGANPKLFTDDFIAKYKAVVFGSNSKTIEDILNLLFEDPHSDFDDVRDFSSWVKYIDREEPDWISNPSSISDSFEDVRDILIKAHGPRFVSAIESVLSNANSFESSAMFEQKVRSQFSRLEPKARPPVKDKPVDPVKVIPIPPAEIEPKGNLNFISHHNRKQCSVKTSDYTRFEKARIVGARSLQISYGAPILVDYPEDMLDPVDIALLEFDQGLIPISVVRS